MPVPVPPPPRVARWLLSCFVGAEHASVIGDLEEDYYDHALEQGIRAATLRYGGQVLAALPYFLMLALVWSPTMFRNYLKVALRTLRKHKSFSAINILGLAVSMAVCLLILLFIKDQRSYDRFHEHADYIYRVVADAVDPDSVVIPVSATPAPLADVLQRDFPGVASVVRLRKLKTQASHDDQAFNLEGFYADAAFFEIFSFPLASGTLAKALTAPNTIILTQETATKFFGVEDPIGQVLTVEGAGDFTITGVLEPVDGKSHLKFEAIASLATLQSWETNQAMLDDWHNFYSYYTYLLLDEGTAPATLERGLPAIVTQHYTAAEQKCYAFGLQPLTAINLGEARNNEIGFILPDLVVYFLAALGLVIMLSACFNYVGLSIARSLSRAREVGVRKVVGARQGQIVRQFVSEGVVVALLALVVACGLLVGLIPVFNNLWFVQMSQTQIALDLTGDASLYAVLIGFSLFVGLASGLYPALYLSRFLPVRVLKGLGKGRGQGGWRLRKTLVITQFVFSMVFIVTIAVLFKQLQFMTDADYGFESEHIVNVALPGIEYESFREALLQDPAIDEVSATSELPASGSVNGVWVQGTDQAEPVRGYEYAIDEHFIDNLGLQLLAGRGFSAAFAADSVQSVIVNETAVRALGYAGVAEALGHTVRLDDGPDRAIVGVVRDYHFNLLADPIRPLMLHYDPRAFRYANVRVQPGTLTRARAHLEATWRRMNPSQPLEYEVFSDQLENTILNILFRDFIQILGLVALLAVVIACLGLFGMAAYTAEARVKEIGVRKVLGATVPHLVLLLSKDFLKLVGLAVLIAAPLAWFGNSLWLQQFAGRFDFRPGLIVVSIGALLVLALITIGSQTLRAALSNPVDTLRSE